MKHSLDSIWQCAGINVDMDLTTKNVIKNMLDVQIG